MLHRFPYHLTSPPMYGDDVRFINRRLKNNRFKNFWGSGEPSGYYKERSKHATRQAKYWLGFPMKYVNGAYGKQLNSYLGGAKLPLAYRLRRKRRLAASVTTQRVRAYRYAVSQLGIKESPAGSNVVKYSTWYGIRGPWCAMFVSWCFVQAGNKLTFQRARHYSYVPYVVADARAGRNGLSVTRTPIRGDLVCYDWDGGVADHIGIFEGWTNKAAGKFSAIEGNTSVNSNSNGGEVMRRFRYRSQVEAFVRVRAG